MAFMIKLLGAAVLACWVGAVAARDRLVDLVASAKPSVVAVGMYNPLGSPRFTPRGTGFVVEDGALVITNAHVLPDERDNAPGSQLRVRIVAGEAAPAERLATVVKVDPAHDLALLAIDGARLPALVLAEAADVPEGTDVVLIGFPIGNLLGLAPVTHRGIVSSVTDMVLPPPSARLLSGRAIRQMRDGPFKIYQLDATAYPGNSGGPLLDVASGRVVGVVNMVAIKGTRETALSTPSGISYAVPVRWVRALLEDR